MNLFILLVGSSLTFFTGKDASVSVCKAFFNLGNVGEEIIVFKVIGNNQGELEAIKWKCLPPEEKDPEPYIEYPSEEDNKK